MYLFVLVKHSFVYNVEYLRKTSKIAITIGYFYSNV